MRFLELAPKLLPKEDRDDLLHLAQEFYALDTEDFFERYPELFIDYDYAAEFEKERQEGIVGLSTVLVWALAERGVLLEIDWEGEEEEGLLASFLEYRLEGMDDRIIRLSADALYRKFRDDAAKPNPELAPGQHVPLLLCYLNEQLRPYGYRMLCFDANCDQYYIGVFPFTEAAWLLSLRFEDIQLLDVNDYVRNSTDLRGFPGVSPDPALP